MAILIFENKNMDSVNYIRKTQSLTMKISSQTQTLIMSINQTKTLVMLIIQEKHIQ